MRRVDVAVLAGGLGTRLRAVLGDTPKLLAPLAGRPYLEHLLGWLSRFGARRVVLLLGHLSSAVIDYVGRRQLPNLEVVPVVEPSPLGTAGALRHARGAFRSDPVLVVNGDTLVDADLCAFLRAFRASRAEGSILCAEVPDAARYGRVELSGEGRIERFREKDAGRPGGGSINAGLYLLSALLLDRIAASGGRSLERDIFSALPPGTLHAWAGLFPFVDIGTPESFRAAQGLLPQIFGERSRSRRSGIPRAGSGGKAGKKG